MGLYKERARRGLGLTGGLCGARILHVVVGEGSHTTCSRYGGSGGQPLRIGRGDAGGS